MACPVDQPLTQEAEGRLRSLPAQLPALMPGEGEGGGKPGFREKETHDGANNPQGCFFIFVFFKAIMNQTGSLQLPIQSISTGRIPIRSINNHLKKINAGNLFSSVILF